MKPQMLTISYRSFSFHWRLIRYGLNNMILSDLIDALQVNIPPAYALLNEEIYRIVMKVSIWWRLIHYWTRCPFNQPDNHRKLKCAYGNKIFILQNWVFEIKISHLQLQLVKSNARRTVTNNKEWFDIEIVSL